MDTDIFFNKIRKLYLLIFTLSLTIGCCSTAPDLQRGYKNDKDFVKYIESFRNDMGSRVLERDMNKTAIRFGDLEEPTVGLCASMPVLGYSVITIDRKGWENKTELEKMELMYHELGHCVCKIGHSWDFGYYQKTGYGTRSNRRDDGFFEDWCPLSIMYPYTIEDECLKKHWEKYIEDLYNRCYP
jgi:hypothetical protein